MSLGTAFAKKQPILTTEIPGPKSLASWEKQNTIIGPGLQRVVQWARLCLVRGQGPFLEDADGNVFIDFMGGSGVNSIGHSHPKYIEAMGQQLSSLAIGSFNSPARVHMLEEFQSIFPKGMDRVQFFSGGTEAVEGALRLAKSHTGKYEFLGFWNGYHGKTMGALALTDGARKGLGPMPPGALTAPYAYCFRCPLKLSFPSCKFACVDHVRQEIKNSSAGSLAGIIVEPIQGRAGNITPPPGYLKELKAVAREFEALLIVDETMTCMGRTGKMFAFEYDDAIPDIVIVGKGLGSGYPVTAVLSTAEIMKSKPFSDPSFNSSSFAAFPMACSAVGSTIAITKAENLPEKARVLGAELLAELKKMEQQIPIMGEARGLGLMLGFELVEDKQSLKPVSSKQMEEIFMDLLRHGVLVMFGSSGSGNSMRLYPPLNIDREIALKGLEILKDVLLRQSAQMGAA
jgi:4-aminobutyrate aminotransferase-like enzyme